MPGDAIAQPTPLGAPGSRRWAPWLGWSMLALALLNTAIVAFVLRSHRQILPAPAGLAGTGLVPTFTLADAAGHAVTASALAGRFTMVYFGYTYCPDICPTELGFEERVLKALGADARRITPVFISVDPQRDTPRALAAYAALFDPRMVAWTGTEAQLHAAIAGFGGMFDRQSATAASASGAGAGGYLINHTSSIYLVGPTGEVLMLCDSHDDVEATAAAVRTWLDHAPASAAPPAPQGRP